MKRRLPGRGRPAEGQAPTTLPALAGRTVRGKRKGPMSREEIASRFKSIINGGPERAPVESPYEPTIYEGEDDE